MEQPWFVYILQNEKDGSHYIGSTYDVAWRLWRHNDGWTLSTRGKRPWRVVYVEVYPTKRKALLRETAIKRMKSRKYIEPLVAGGRPDAAPKI
jgi:putative endonuclease